MNEYFIKSLRQTKISAHKFFCIFFDALARVMTPHFRLPPGLEIVDRIQHWTTCYWWLIFYLPSLAEPNIVRYRTIQAQATRCSGYLVPQPVGLNDHRFKKLQNWLVVFEQPYALSTLQMLMLLRPRQQTLDSADWAKIQLNNGSVVSIGKSCGFEKATMSGSTEAWWDQVFRAKCDVGRLPPALGISFENGLRIRDLRAFGKACEFETGISGIK